MSWIVPISGGCVLTVKACPRANRTEVAGIDADWIRVRIQAPPVDGKANAELIRFFTEKLDLPKRSVEIMSGDTGRVKRVKLCGADAETVKVALSSDGFQPLKKN